jgi:hypothetical protein
VKGASARDVCTRVMKQESDRQVPSGELISCRWLVFGYKGTVCEKSERHGTGIQAGKKVCADGRICTTVNEKTRKLTTTWVLRRSLVDVTPPPIVIGNDYIYAVLDRQAMV